MFSDAARTFFASKGWVRKALIGTLISLIPYVGAFVIYGYGLELNRRVAWGTSDELPEWDSFSVYLKRGFFGFLVAMVYSLPATLITSVLAGLLSLAFGAGIYGGASMAVFFALFMVGIVVLLLLGSAAVMPFMYSGLIHYNLYDALGQGLAFKAVWARMKENRSLLMSTTWRTIGYMTAVTLLIFVGMTPYFLFLGTIITDPRMAADPTGALGYLGLQAVFAIAYPFVMFGSFIGSQMVWIMWGRYAREAYGLAGAPTQG